MSAVSRPSQGRTDESAESPKSTHPGDPLAALDALTFATFEVVRTYIERHPISSSDVASFIVSTHAALSSITPATLKSESTGIGGPEKPGEKDPSNMPNTAQAIAREQTIFNDYIVCLEDGKSFKSLTRHLRKLGLTPEEYRRKWSLPTDYPMEAPSLAARRLEVAANFARRKGVGASKKVQRKD